MGNGRQSKNEERYSARKEVLSKTTTKVAVISTNHYIRIAVDKLDKLFETPKAALETPATFVKSVPRNNLEPRSLNAHKYHKCSYMISSTRKQTKEGKNNLCMHIKV